jgi:hypothetical protein
MREADLDDIRNSVNFETARRSDEFDEAAEDEAYIKELGIEPLPEPEDDGDDEEEVIKDAS